MKLDITTGKTIIDFKENKIDLATHIVNSKTIVWLLMKKQGEHHILYRWRKLI